MSSIKNKIKFFENQKKEQTINKQNKINDTVNTNKVKKNISHWNKIRQDVLNKPYISQTTYAFGRNQTIQVPINKLDNIIKPSPNLNNSESILNIKIKPLNQNQTNQTNQSNQNIDNSFIEHLSDNDDIWMNSIIN
tara:strand:- start:1241 stop:1648 length:408 start_codon:yes stop_codon:yes gene_type:complete